MKVQRNSLFSIAAGLFLCSSIIAGLTGCSSSSAPSSNNSSVMMKSEFTQNHVTPNSIHPKGGAIIQGQPGLFVDSLEVVTAKIFIKDIKLHHEENDSLDDEHDESIKVGPFVVEFDSSGAQLVTSAIIPPGTYDRIKLEIHQYDADHDKHDDLDKDDSEHVFKDPEKYTFVISGYVWNGGIRSPFTYYSKVTANIDWRFNPDITIGTGFEQALLLKLDPVFMFRVIGFTLDPRDPSNRKTIDFAIKSAISFWTKF